MLSITNDELYICRIINRKTKKRAINNAIIEVVPQPGATFPYSELKGRKTPPKRVLNAINYFVYEFKTLKLKIYYLKQFVRNNLLYS